MPCLCQDLRRERRDADLARTPADRLRLALALGDADDPLRGIVRFARPPEPDMDLVVGRSAWQARRYNSRVPERPSHKQQRLRRRRSVRQSPAAWLGVCSQTFGN